MPNQGKEYCHNCWGGIPYMQENARFSDNESGAENTRQHA